MKTKDFRTMRSLLVTSLLLIIMTSSCATRNLNHQNTSQEMSTQLPPRFSSVTQTHFAKDLDVLSKRGGVFLHNGTAFGFEQLEKAHKPTLIMLVGKECGHCTRFTEELLEKFNHNGEPTFTPQKLNLLTLIVDGGAEDAARWKRGALTHNKPLSWPVGHMNPTPTELKGAKWDPKTYLPGSQFFSKYCKVGIGYPCLFIYKKTMGFVTQQRSQKKFNPQELTEGFEAVRYVLTTDP